MFPRWCLRLSLVFLLQHTVQAQTIDAYTTEYPPYESAHFGLPSGYAVEVVKELAHRNGDQVVFHFFPWARTYALAEQHPDSLIFCMSKSDMAGSKFVWLGNIAANDVALWQLRTRNDIHLYRLADAKSYQIGVVRNDYKTRYMLSQGFRSGQQLQESDSDLTNLRKLLAGHLDLLPANDSESLEQLMRDNALDPKLLKPALHLPELTSPLGIAFSPASSPALTQRYTRTLEKMRQDGFMDKQKVLLNLSLSSAHAPN